MRSRFAPWMLVVVVFALVLSACGGQQAATPTTAPAAEAPTATVAADAPAAEPTAETVQFPQEPAAGQKVIVWMVRSGVTENRWEANVVIPAWQKANPDVFVKVLNINQDDIAVKREAMIAAKEPLHVFSSNWGGDGFASDRFRGLIENLSPLIERDKWDTSDFIPEVFSIYNIEGKQWGIPFLTTGTYVYYNMKLFDEAGVPYPTTDWDDKSWNWDAFLALAKKLTKNYGDPNTGVYGGNNGIWPPFDGIPMIWGRDPFPLSGMSTGFPPPVMMTDDTTVAAFQAMHDLVHKDKVAPDSSVNQALEQLGGAFASGRVAMHITGGWGHWNYKDYITDPNGFCWGAAPLPWGTPDAVQRATIFTDPWVVTAGLAPEEMDLAWKFVQFIASPEQAQAYTDATGTPPTRSSLLKSYYKQYEKCMDPAKVEAVFQGAFTHGKESSNHLLVRYNEISQTYSNILSSTYWDDPAADTKAMLTQLEADMNETLKRIAEDSK